MNKKIIFLFLVCVFSFFLIFPHQSFAIENPLAVPNNKIGMHILFPEELKPASKLINSQGGDWGYVTMTIQAGDKDLNKWQKFMDDAARHHLIPIIRLSTEGDIKNTAVWRKPTDTDIIDFANFLNSLEWPVKNRYIIVFNEVNRSDEWGGSLNPREYSNILSFAVTVFKSKNPDFFIISAGLDNAAPNQAGLFMNQYDYLRQMNQAVPGIFNQIDGLSSHSYPNPGFAQRPNTTSPMGTGSFHYERQLVQSLSRKALPVFITETGWSTEAVSDATAASYYILALNTAWSDNNIVAITPFLFQGSGGVFEKFTFLRRDGSFTQQYTTLKNLQKIKGKPLFPPRVLSSKVTANQEPADTKDFSKHKTEETDISISPELRDVFKWLMKI